MANFKITITNPGPKFKEQMAAEAARFNKAIETTVNMIASMLSDAFKKNIADAGLGRWQNALHVNVLGATPNMKIAMSTDSEKMADILALFEDGGTIGPMKGEYLWLPLSGTDAVGKAPSEYGGLFSMKHPRKSGGPLLFSIADKMPRYVGISSVKVAGRLDLGGTEQRVINQFRDVFAQNFKGS